MKCGGFGTSLESTQLQKWFPVSWVRSGDVQHLQLCSIVHNYNDSLTPMETWEIFLAFLYLASSSIKCADIPIESFYVNNSQARTLTLHSWKQRQYRILDVT